MGDNSTTNGTNRSNSVEGGSEPIDAESLVTYLACPRRYEYEHELGIESDDSSRDADRAIARVRRTILRRLANTSAMKDDGRDDRRRGTRARRFTDWIQRAAVQAYFDTYGERHGQSVLATDLELAYETESGTIVCPVDALVEIDGRPVALRYRWTLEGVEYSSPSGVVRRHTGGRSHYPRRAGSVLVAGATIEAIAATGRYDSNPGFAYVGLTDSVGPGRGDSSGSDGSEPGSLDVNVSVRRLESHYEDERNRCRNVLNELVETVLDRAFDPAENWEAISNDECNSCPYSVMCADRINQEVRFR